MTEIDIDVFPKSCCQVLYSDVVDGISTNKKKINQKQYLKSGEYQVIDQGQDEVGGYTNDSGLIIVCDLPVIIFGDHTRIVKYRKQPFAVGADGVKVFQPKKIILPKLVEYFTRYLAIKIRDKGYARHYQWVAKENIDIPPLSEQHRVVQKIEELFSELDKGIESLKTARDQLKVYRQALLEHAFEGKLTEQWRKDNADKLETADELLARIQQEREDRYQLQLGEWEIAVEEWENEGSKGKKPVKPTKIIGMIPITNDDLVLLTKLPNGWVWVRYGDLCSVVRNEISKKPVGETGGKFFRISAVRPMHCVMSDYRIIDNMSGEFNAYFLRKDDLIFTRYNGSRRYVGVCAAYKSDEPRLFPDKLVQTRPDLPMLTATYLEKALNSGSSRKYVESKIRTTAGQSGVSGVDIKNIPVPICSVDEQIEISGYLDAALSELDQNLKIFEACLSKSEALRQSILKKSFSGKLVPQDPNDEPASELLKRIAQEKTDNETLLKAAKAKNKK